MIGRQSPNNQGRQGTVNLATNYTCQSFSLDLSLRITLEAAGSTKRPGQGLESQSMRLRPKSKNGSDPPNCNSLRTAQNLPKRTSSLSERICSRDWSRGRRAAPFPFTHVRGAGSQAEPCQPAQKRRKRAANRGTFQRQTFEALFL